MKSTTIITKQKFGSYILQYIYNRLHVRNKNCIMVLNGATGSGKTYAALKLCETMDKNFTIENVCFSPEEFLDLVNDTHKVLKRGACILWDEIQVEMGALDFASFTSKAINRVLSTFRHRNLMLVITCPDFAAMNLTSRKLTHIRMETQMIDTKLKLCKLKVLLLQLNQDTGKIYQKFLRYVDEDGDVQSVPETWIGLPGAALLETYEKKRVGFTRLLNSDMRQEIEIRKLRKLKKTIDLKKGIRDIATQQL